MNATSLGIGFVPRVDDRGRGTDGVWWTVKVVGALDGGEWPLACEREGADPAPKQPPPPAPPVEPAGKSAGARSGKGGNRT